MSIDIEKEKQKMIDAMRESGVRTINTNTKQFNDHLKTWYKRAELAEKEINDLKQQIAELHSSRESLLEYKNKVESDDVVLLQGATTRKGGYYIQDKRSYLGNCMLFWFTHGYGTKHSKFHWFETLEQAQDSAGGAPWFEIWYAPYIDSLIESTIDCQYVNRDQEKAMIEASQ
jgi:hypothetical protein